MPTTPPATALAVQPQHQKTPQPGVCFSIRGTQGSDASTSSSRSVHIARTTPLAILITVLFTLTAAACCGEVYRWRDDRGHAHYSDRPKAGADRIAVQAPPPSSSSQALVRVVKVYDGDTIVLDGGDKVRLLGINTPEVAGHRKSEEAGGEEAKAWLRREIQGRRVRVEQDVSTRDKYQRLLAHVFREDGTHINLALVDAGLATTDIHPPNLKYVNLLVEAERRAERAQRGIWNLAEYQAKVVEFTRNRKLSGWQRLVGKPIAVEKGRGYWRLQFPDQFSVRIPEEHLSLFPPLHTYLHQMIEARGWVSHRGDRYSVLVRHPSALIER